MIIKQKNRDRVLTKKVRKKKSVNSVVKLPFIGLLISSGDCKRLRCP